LLDNHTITEFNYRYTPSNQARIFVGVALSKGLNEKQVLIDKLSLKHQGAQEIQSDTKPHYQHQRARPPYNECVSWQ
jgi:threonine dehydratase